MHTVENAADFPKDQGKFIKIVSAQNHKVWNFHIWEAGEYLNELYQWYPKFLLVNQYHFHILHKSQSNHTWMYSQLSDKPPILLMSPVHPDPHTLTFALKLCGSHHTEISNTSKYLTTHLYFICFLIVLFLEADVSSQTPKDTF